MLEIMRLTASDISDVVPLFNAYRVFYGQESNIDAAKTFLEQRLANHESIIFLATWDNRPIGFTQLYTSFSSVSLRPIYILNDLFVDSAYRGRGIGGALLNRAKTHCTNSNHKGLALETALDNPAQNLYEKLGWKKDTDYLHYFWTNTE